MLQQFLLNLTGVFPLTEWDNDQLIRAANPQDSDYDFRNRTYVNAPQGLTRFTQNNPEIILCRTRLGLLFPSLRFISLEEAPVIRPDLIRKLFGIVWVLFTALVPIISLATAIGIGHNGKIPVLFLICLIVLFNVLVFFVFWTATKLERYLLTRGIAEFIDQSRSDP